MKFNISGRNYQVGAKISDYIEKKIGSLEKYLPRSAGDPKADIVLELDSSGRENNQCVCEVIIQLPGAVLQSKEATVNMYAAVDIVEAKLKAQALKYKDKHSPRAKRGKIWVNKLLGRDHPLDT